MSKITLNNLDSLTNESTALTALNTNFATIQDAIDNLLSRDGTSPNTIEANLDMNSYRIQNLPEAVDPTEPVRLGDIDELLALETLPSKWYSGAGVPSNSLYEVGDWYINTTTSDIYEKTGAAAWTLRVNIKGETGAAGPPGAGTGDMLKSVYDANDDGVVTAAASAPWAGITSKPTTLSGYGITDAQPLATKLTNFNALTWAANTFPVFTGTNTLQASQITTAGLALLDDASAAAQRTTLGLGTMALRESISTGDIVNGAVTLAKLDTTGANGLVLTAQGAGAAPIWAAAGSSGSSHILLATVTPTAATTAVASGLTLTSYKKLLIEWVATRNGSTSSSFRIAGVAVTGTNGTSTTPTFSGYAEINLRTGFGTALGRASTATTLTETNGIFNILNNTTSITFSPSTGSFVATGTIYIYGVQ